MLYEPMIHPQPLHALATTGHGSRILLADANYPHTTGVNPRCELISLNLAPGLLDVSQVPDVFKRTVPIKRAETMIPAPDADSMKVPVHNKLHAVLPGVEFGEVSHWDFCDAAHDENVGTIVATGEQRLYDNLLLTVGVRRPGKQNPFVTPGHALLHR